MNDELWSRQRECMCTRERERGREIPSSFLVGGLRWAAQTRPLPTHLPGLPPSLSRSLSPFRSLPLPVSLFPPFLSATSLPEGKCTKPIRKSGVPAGPCVRYAAVKGPLFAVFTGDVEKNRGAALPHGPRRVCFCSTQPAASLSGLWSTQDVDQNAIAHSERAWHRERKCSCPETPERYRAWGRSGNDPGMWLFCALAGAG